MSTARHYLSGSFADHDRASDRDERPLRVIQGGRKPRALRPLRAVEALSLAWVAGLVHDQLHPFSNVMIDEGSCPVELPGEVASSATYALLARRGFVTSARVDGETVWSLTELGFEEVIRQRLHGHLATVVPFGWDDPANNVEPGHEYADACYAVAAAEWGAL